MVSKILSATVIGLNARLVHVEVHFSREKSHFYIVGLPDKACSESKERVSAIVKNYIGKRLPAGTFTVNLSPADILKSGPVYDLPIALGMLHVMGKIDFDPHDKLIIGQLSLDGKVRYTKAILPIADLARKKNVKELYVPKVNADEASLIPSINVVPVSNLEQLIGHINKTTKIKIKKTHKIKKVSLIKNHWNDISYVRGQEHAKRALEIAAAGGHNLLMSGPPGSGKTMLAKTLPTILSRLSLDESLEITRICSVAGLLPERTALISIPPFRKPHHTISHVALVGGGTIPRPGEITLAHRGVLFLDEFTEFSNSALEALRQPLEDGMITISRAKGTITFPAKLMLIAAMNPCKCGWLGDDKHECTCTPSDIIRYKKKISGPILDRIDMKIFVKRVKYEKLSSKLTCLPSGMEAQSSKQIRKKVQTARSLQAERFSNSWIITNSEMGQKEIEKFLVINKKCKSLLARAMESLNLSARGYFRLLKVSRTIADLEQNERITHNHIAEALSFRLQDGE